MATPAALADVVTSAILGGSTSLSTVTTLQTLLSVADKDTESKPETNTRNPRQPTTAATSRRAAPARAPARGVKRDPDVKIYADEARTLSPKARQALATQVINISLRVLSDALKSPCHNTSTPRRLSTVLQPRSGNATPAPSTPAKQKAPSRRPSQSSVSGNTTGPSHVTSVAECARLAFSYLRSLTPAKPSSVTDDRRQLQLEQGMIALSGQLVNHGLYALACKELRAVKRRLESLMPLPGQPSNKPSPQKVAGCDNLSLLLRLELDWDAHPQLWPLISTYYMHVIHAIAGLRKRSSIEEVLPYLAIGRQGSPAYLILQQTKQTGQAVRAVKLLDALWRGILQLCPAISSSADEDVRRSERHPRPLCAFKLQMLSLSVRQEMCALADHDICHDHDVAVLFTKCLGTLLRRLPHNEYDVEMFSTCMEAYGKLLGRVDGKSEDEGDANASILRLLSTLAEKASLYEDARKLAERALSSCKDLPNSHARTMAMMTRKLIVSLHTSPAKSETLLCQTQELSHALRNKICGNSLDSKVLLAELLSLVRILYLNQGDERMQRDKRILSGAAAQFASLHEKSFPGCDLEVAQEIICSALSHCGSDDTLLEWVSVDTSRVLIRSGILANVAEKLSRRPMVQAWTSCSRGIAFGRLLKILILKAASSPLEKCKSLLIDGDDLGSSERGALIEWQFKCAIDVAHKPKYRCTMQTLLPELLGRLAKIYTATQYPLRRSRVAAKALRAREMFPDLVPPHTLEIFAAVINVDETDLGRDQILAPYAADIKASLIVSRAFYNGSATVDALWPSLQAWTALLEKADDTITLQEHVDNPAFLSAQLLSIEQYFGMLAEDTARLYVAEMLVRVSSLSNSTIGRYGSGVVAARAYLSLGYAEKASEFLDSMSTAACEPSCKFEELDQRLCQAEILLALNRFEDCRSKLEAALHIRQELNPKEVKNSERTRYRILHGLGWLVHSEFSMANSAPNEALRAAKRAVKIINSTWASIQNHDRPSEALPSEDSLHADPQVEDITDKVSKLNLKPTAHSSSTLHQRTTKGAALWPVLRILCRSLMHLADLYVHHGIFAEAKHAYEQAASAAECAGSTRLLSLVRSYQSRALLLAHRLEEAELCLARDDMEVEEAPSLVKVARLRAKAAITYGDPKTAAGYLRDAAALVCTLRSVTGKSTLAGSVKGVIGSKEVAAAAVKGKRSAPLNMRGERASGRASKGALKSGKTRSETAVHAANTTPCYVLQKLEATLLLEAALLSAKCGGIDTPQAPLESSTVWVSLSDRFECRLIEHESIMRKVAATLQADLTLNSLQESTLAFPALASARKRGSVHNQSPQSPRVKNPTKSGRPTKEFKHINGPDESLEALLIRARGNLELDGTVSKSLTTVETHKIWSMLSSVTMMSSVTPAYNALSAAREALAVDAARIFASKARHAVFAVERELYESSDPFVWPDLRSEPASARLSGKLFQDDFVDILPAPWTAVSLRLNEAADELYIARYRRSQQPFVLRVPLSRPRSEDADEEIFGFHMGKAELEEIIALSNYSCHNSQGNGLKGAKTTWWAERETLDRRLQDLLTNIENIWFGGFKGIFAQQHQDYDQLQRFRKDLDGILNRHLPSRRTNRRASKQPILDDQILELFTGLDFDPDADSTLDDSLADLLYFVVDIFQFHGERNAYDEVDFDNMAIEVQDALQAYHEDAETVDHEAAHVVLVLDSRLQALPWESLPCLERSSVSRVDSMLTLRECIMAMRLKATDVGRSRHMVSRTSGSYILNPSSDLLSTETTLAPELSKLAESSGWRSIVRKQPSEDEFKAALATSSTLLYFGHGAGSQYIRPKTVRRLDNCSEVVWLMGCSSGAVTEYGDLEPLAVPLAYLGAGHHDATNAVDEGVSRSKCLAVVATLWDVTDKDIDRFSLAVGEEWGLWNAPQTSTKLPMKTPRKREKGAVPSTPERPAKTPKTPKVRKTPAPARTPARDRSRSRAGSEDERPKSLVEAVARSRDACYLRYLNGAAPVVYGVPVYLED